MLAAWRSPNTPTNSSVTDGTGAIPRNDDEDNTRVENAEGPEPEPPAYLFNTILPPNEETTRSFDEQSMLFLSNNSVAIVDVGNGSLVNDGDDDNGNSLENNNTSNDETNNTNSFVDGKKDKVDVDDENDCFDGDGSEEVLSKSVVENKVNASQQLEAGDHIYSWRALGAYSHHGIVLSVSKVAVVIVDFYPEKGNGNINSNGSNDSSDNDARTGSNSNIPNNNNQTNNNPRITNGVGSPPTVSSRRQKSGSSKSSNKLTIRTLEEWKQLYGRPYKVIYKASYLGRTLRRSGTCTSVETAPSCLVMARVRFLLSSEGESYLPHYHYLYANSETLSFWCKTGDWATLQVADFLHVNIAGQLKSSVTLAGYVSTQTVSVPSAGFWGYMGFTTKVTLAAAQPYLLPLIASYGVLTVGGPLWMLYQCKHKWKFYSKELHDSFWSHVSNDVIVECIQQWCSDTLSPSISFDEHNKQQQ